MERRRKGLWRRGGRSKGECGGRGKDEGERVEEGGGRGVGEREREGDE